MRKGIASGASSRAAWSPGELRGADRLDSACWAGRGGKATVGRHEDRVESLGKRHVDRVPAQAITAASEKPSGRSW
jgi:hypothetical protein